MSGRRAPRVRLRRYASAGSRWAARPVLLRGEVAARSAGPSGGSPAPRPVWARCACAATARPARDRLRPGANWLLDRPTRWPGCATTSRASPRWRRATRGGAAGPRAPGLRLPATGRVYQRLLRAVLEQKVTGTEAYRAYVALGAPLPPGRRGRAGARARSGTTAATRPGRRGGDALLGPASVSAWSSAAPTRWPARPSRRSPGALRRRHRGHTSPDRDPGHWRMDIVRSRARVAFGDPDAVSVGDYHIPHMVSWALAGEARAGSRSAGPSRSAALAALPTTGCSSCSNPSAGTGAGSACCWNAAAWPRPGSARACRSARSPPSNAPSPTASSEGRTAAATMVRRPGRPRYARTSFT